MGATSTVLGSASADGDGPVITGEDINTSEEEDEKKKPIEKATNVGEDSYGGGTSDPLESRIAATMAHYESNLTRTEGWEHDMMLNGIGACFSSEDEELLNKFNGLKLEAKFEEDDYEDFRGNDDWYMDFTQHGRGIYPFDGDGDDLISDNYELAVDVFIPALVGAFNPIAGVGAAVGLSVDNFVENMEPDKGDSTIEHGGVKVMKKNGYWDGSEAVIAFTQHFEVIHDPGKAGINFEASAKAWDRVLDFLGNNQEPEVVCEGSTFGDGMVVNTLSADEAETAEESETQGTSDPAQMTQEQREEYGIKRVDPSVQDLFAEEHNTKGDEVLWTTAGGE